MYPPIIGFKRAKSKMPEAAETLSLKTVVFCLWGISSERHDQSSVVQREENISTEHREESVGS